MSNRKTIVTTGASEYFEYLSNFSFSDYLENTDFKRCFRAIYKRYHPIITWNSYLKTTEVHRLSTDEQYERFSVILYRNSF